MKKLLFLALTLAGFASSLNGAAASDCLSSCNQIKQTLAPLVQQTAAMDCTSINESLDKIALTAPLFAADIAIAKTECPLMVAAATAINAALSSIACSSVCPTQTTA